MDEDDTYQLINMLSSLSPMTNKKIQLGLVLAATFLAGGMVANLDIVAEAAQGESNSAWKKLLARVTALEERVTALEEQDPPTADVKFVQLNDDAAGNAAGWNPDGSTTAFFISDSDVTSDSIVTLSIADPSLAPSASSESPSGVVFVIPNEGFSVGCQCQIVSEGAILNYMIVAPESED